MRRLLPSLTALAIALAAAPAGAQPARRAAQTFDADGERAMLAKINQMRAAQSLAPLQRHEGLDEAARAHSRDMAAHQELVHVSERTGTPAARVREAGVTAVRIGENIARHATTAGALDAILGSEAHRGQLLEATFTHVGLAALPGEGGVYVTQVFATMHAPAELPPPAVEEPALPPPSATDTPAEPQPTPPQVDVEEADAIELDEADSTPELAAGVPHPPQALPRLRVPAGHRDVAGYWVHKDGRWWYFPVPANAAPGQLLMPDPSVEGPPPGVREVQPQAAPGASGIRVQRRVVHPRTRRGVISPRRGGTIYWY